MKAYEVKGQVVPFNRSSGYLYKKALANHKNKNYIEAIDLFRRAYETKAEPDTLVALATVLTDMGCYELSNRELYNALALDSNCHTAFYALAVNHYHLSNPQMVLDAATVYLRREPEGRFCAQVRELVEWALFYDEKGGRGRLDMLERLAHADLKMGNRARALKRYRRVARSLGHTCAALYQLTLRLIEMKLYKQALLVANKLLRRYPKEAKTICASVRVHDALGNRALATELAAGLSGCERADDSDTAVFEACVLIKAYRAGVDYLSRSLSAAPYDTELLARLAYLHLRLGDALRAKRFYLKVCTIDPKNQEAQEALRLIASGEEKDISPPGELAPRVQIERLRRLSKILYGGEAKMGPEDKEIIDWALRSHVAMHAQALLNIVLTVAPSEAPLWIRQWLLSPDVSDAIKSEAALLMARRKEEPQVMLYQNKMASSVLMSVQAIAAKNRAAFAKGFMFEARDVGRPEEAASFCLKHYDALPDKSKVKAIGEGGYAYQAALKIMFLRSLDMEKNVVKYINELPISLRRVERAMNDFLRVSGKDGLDETH